MQPAARGDVKTKFKFVGSKTHCCPKTRLSDIASRDTVGYVFFVNLSNYGLRLLCYSIKLWVTTFILVDETMGYNFYVTKSNYGLRLLCYFIKLWVMTFVTRSNYTLRFFISSQALSRTLITSLKKIFGSN